MKLKLDENPGASALCYLEQAGYDVSTVALQKLCGADDRSLIDLDFTDAMEYAVRDFKTNHARYLEIWRKAQGRL